MMIFGIVTLVYLVISFTLVFGTNSLPFTPLKKNQSHVTKSVSLSKKYPHMIVTARDGSSLFVRKVGVDSERVIIFLHGIASTHQAVFKTATELHEATGAQILIPDLRGHGDSGGTKFDVAYIGQYEDDLEDLILSLKEQQAESSNKIYKQIVIGGHSMGGGITMRYALKENKPEVDAYLLFAPNFGEGPTQREATYDEEHNAPIHFNTARMIGLLMLNTIGIDHLDSLPIMYFNFPPQMKSYSYRSILSAQPIRPNTTEKALLQIQVPLLVVIGSQDEVFLASAYPSYIKSNSALGETILVENADHMGILLNEEAINEVSKWFGKRF